MAYQSIGGAKGASDSEEKLTRLRLNRLGPIKGKSVLDLGCNEGFFCGAVLEKGAARVLGIDQWQGVIAKARDRFPKAEFKVGSWWDLPDEKFDLILFLSAVHYEPRQRALFDKLLNHLTPTGTLVLECGLAPHHLGLQGWIQIHRPKDTVPRRYPSMEYLREHLMPDYVVTGVGKSVMQKGDPIGRWVFHCERRKPIVVIVTGPQGDGKSHLGFTIGTGDVPVYRTDALFRRLLDNPLYEITPLVPFLKETGTTSCSALAIALNSNEGFAEQFAQIVCDEAPLDAPACIIEGEVFRQPLVMHHFTRLLRERGAIVWIAGRSRD
jgi:SAM-dependent methyltransferase